MTKDPDSSFSSITSIVLDSGSPSVFSSLVQPLLASLPSRLDVLGVHTSGVGLSTQPVLKTSHFLSALDGTVGVRVVISSSLILRYLMSP